MTGLNLWPRTISQNGNIRRRHAEGPGFGSRRDQYLNWRNKTQTCHLGPLVETVTFVAVTPKVPGSIPAGTSI